ncbi:sulfatase-like hydrolase/transferase [Myxococcota bacterium]|nr:sulfatase-like hydrolase/transferase [Myxococcota bacterium]
MRGRRWRIIVAPALAILVLLTGCGQELDPPPTPDPAHERPPDILLVVLCTFRYSHMGAAGYPRETTPFLDDLARQGLFFENAVSAANWTKPATASLLTGLPPNAHGMTDFYDPLEVMRGQLLPKRVLPDGVVTLAETLQEAGYATAARINNVHVSEHFGMTQGFDNAIASPSLNASTMVDEFENWVQTVPPDQPFFFLLMSRDAHVTFDPDYRFYRAFNRVEPIVPLDDYPRYVHKVRRWVMQALESGRVEPELAKRYVDLYDAELAQQDAALSRLPSVLERTDRAHETLIVVTADHGERFFEHGRVGHGGGRLDDATLRIPMILSGHAAPKGVRDPRVVRSIDLFPTIARLAGARIPEGLPGLDLLTGNDTQPPREAFASAYGDEHMVRRGSETYYRRRKGGPELYDLARDPGEGHDLSKLSPERVTDFQRRVDEWLAWESSWREGAEPIPSRQLPDDAVDALRALGYLESTAP